jgi:hypothetical protein
LIDWDDYYCFWKKIAPPKEKEYAVQTDKQQTHGGSGLKAALHPNARSTGGSGFVSVALGRCPFAKPQGTVHSLHGTTPIL